MSAHSDVSWHYLSDSEMTSNKGSVIFAPGGAVLSVGGAILGHSQPSIDTVSIENKLDLEEGKLTSKGDVVVTMDWYFFGDHSVYNSVKVHIFKLMLSYSFV